MLQLIELCIQVQRFLVSGFCCKCLLPNKEEKLEEAWEPVFSFGHFYQSILECGVVGQTLFSSLFDNLPNVRPVKIVLRSVKSQGIFLGSYEWQPCGGKGCANGNIY